MGYQIELTLERIGFYPAGGGCIVTRIAPIKQTKAIELKTRGVELSRKARAIANHLPSSIAKREVAVLQKRLQISAKNSDTSLHQPSPGSGNVVFVELAYESLTEVFTDFGEHGISAEKVASKVCSEVERYLKSDAAVGDYLADQLLLPFALAGRGSFTCTALSKHFKTNLQTIKQFLDINIQTKREARLAWNITFNK